MLYLSIDGGATKSIGILYDDEKILKAEISGPTNFRNVGIKNFKRNIKEITDSLTSDIGYDKIDIATFALAGIKDSEKSTMKITSEIKSIVDFRKMEFYNDGEAAFFSRFPEGEGIIVAPGTGMVSYGIWKDQKVRTSGWGWFLDDEGGAFYIGRRALQESVKAFDSRYDDSIHAESILPEKIKEFYKIKNDREIINKVYKAKINIREIASLAPLVSKLAGAGDKLSAMIMDEAANETIATVEATYRKLGEPEGIGISGYGGVFRSGEWYINKIFGTISSRLRNTSVIEPLYGYEAVLGSMIMVLNRYGHNFQMKDIWKLRKELNESIMALPVEKRKKYLFMD